MGVSHVIFPVYGSWQEPTSQSVKGTRAEAILPSSYCTHATFGSKTLPWSQATSQSTRCTTRVAFWWSTGLPSTSGGIFCLQTWRGHNFWRITSWWAHCQMQALRDKRGTTLCEDRNTRSGMMLSWKNGQHERHVLESTRWMCRRKTWWYGFIVLHTTALPFVFARISSD